MIHLIGISILDKVGKRNINIYYSNLIDTKPIIKVVKSCGFCISVVFQVSGYKDSRNLA